MSTRKLITLALLCGLAILLAGGIQLVILSGRSKSSSGVLLHEGVTARVGAVDATLVSHHLDGQVVVLDVRLAGPSSDASGWALVSSTGTLVPRLSAGSGCLGGGSCEVRFNGRGVAPKGLIAIYGQGDQRRSWELAS